MRELEGETWLSKPFTSMGLEAALRETLGHNDAVTEPTHWAPVRLTRYAVGDGARRGVRVGLSRG